MDQKRYFRAPEITEDAWASEPWLPNARFQAWHAWAGEMIADRYARTWGFGRGLPTQNQG